MASLSSLHLSDVQRFPLFFVLSGNSDFSPTGTRKKLKEEGVIGTTMDALDGAASAVGSGVGMVGTGVATGAGLVGTGIGVGAGLVGTGIGAGAGLVGSGIGAGVGFVGSGLGAVGSGLSRAGKFMGRTITGQGSSRRSDSNTPVNVRGRENDFNVPFHQWSSVMAMAMAFN